MVTQDNSIWSEKYRPQDLGSFVGNSHIKSRIADYVKNNDPPHLLFYGQPGIGKTTLARMIVNSIDCDKLEINAAKDNSIEVIRNRVVTFASVCGFSRLKVIMLDEFGYLSESAQSALRSTIEQFSADTRFILTSNSIGRIDEAIRSRTQSFKLFPPSVRDVEERAIQILTAEGIAFDKADLSQLVNSAYPDIRQTINLLQQHSMNGKLSIQKPTFNKNELETKLREILKNGWTRKTVRNIQKLFADYKISDTSAVFSILCDTIDYLAPKDLSSFLFTSGKLPYELVGLIHLFESRAESDRKLEVSISEIKSVGNRLSTQKSLDLVDDLTQIGYIKRKDKQTSKTNIYTLCCPYEFKQILNRMDVDFVREIRRRRRSKLKKKDE